MKLPCWLVIFFILPGIEAFSQANPITSAPPAAGYARHETDAQNQIQLTLDASVATFSCSGGGCSAWTVNVGGVDVAISSVTVSGTVVLINFTPPVSIGQAVTVQYTGGNGINAFGPITSYNDRVIACSDFTFQALIENTPPCAPVKPINKMVFVVSRAARNSQRWAATTKQVRVHWITDGAAPFSDLNSYESSSAGVPTANTYFLAVDAAPDLYQYPTNDVVCGYSSVWKIRLTAGVTSTVCPVTSANQTVVYASHNTDAQGEGTGQLNLPPTIAATNLVCLGNNVNMTFSDNTQLNCNAPPPAPPIPTNDEIRWVRVRYGWRDEAVGNIPNIIVGGGVGVPVTDASGNRLFPDGYYPVSPATTTFGNPDIFGVVQINRPVNGPRGILELIRTLSPAGQAVGQRLWVRLEYWNICNAYTTGDFSNVRWVENFVEIIDKPLPPTVPNRDICEAESRQLSVTPALAGHTYRWYNTLANAQAGGATGLLNTGTNFTPSSAQAPAGSSTNFFVIAILGNGCVSDPTTVTLTRRSALSIAGLTIQGPANLCPESSYSFNVNVPPAAGGPGGEPTRYRWQVPAGWTILPADGIGQTVTITTGSATGSGTITVNYEYTNLTSNATRCGLTITSAPVVRAKPTANITPDPVDICEGTNVQLNGNPVLPPAAGGFAPTIASHVWGGNVAILDATNVQQPNILNSAPAGAYNVTYVVTANFGGGVTCDSDPVNRPIAISANPGVASTGPNQLLCIGAPLDSNPLGGSNPAPGTGLWSIVSQPIGSTATVANFVDPTDGNTIFTGDINGIYVLRWTVTNASCSSFSEITVDFGSPPPIPTAIAAPDVCGNSTILTGSDPLFSTGTWSVIAGPGTATFSPSSNDPNASVAVTQFGGYTFQWQLQSGSCPTEQTTVDVEFREPPTLISITDFTACVNNPPSVTIPVFASYGGGAANARWETAVGTGVFQSSGASTGNFITNPVEDTYIPSVADFGAGSVQLRVITNDPAGACSPVNNIVTITFDRLPAIAAAGPDNSTCDPSINLNATAATNGGTGIWSAGQLLYQETFSTPNIGLTGPVGATVFTEPGNNWTVTVPAGSLIDGSDWTRVQNAVMEARDVTNEVVWRSAIVNIGAFTSNAVTLELAAFGDMEADDYIRAYYRINGGPEILIGQIEGNNVIEGNGGYRQVSVSGISGTTLEVILRIRSNDEYEYHRFDNVIISGSNLPVPVIADFNNPATAVTDLPVGNSSFSWTVKSSQGFCSSSTDEVVIIRHPLPTINTVAPSNLCEDAVGANQASAVDLTQYNNAINGGCATCTVDWFYGPGATNPVPVVTNETVSNGEIFFIRVTENSLTPNCQNTGALSFVVNALPVAINQFPEFCEETLGGNVKNNINLTTFDNTAKGGIAANTVSWFDNTLVPVADPTNVSASSGTVFISRISDVNGCRSDASLSISINPIPAPNPISGADQVCVDPNSVNLYQVTNINSGSTYAWSIPEPPFVKFGGGGTNDFFLLLAFPTVTSPGMDISVIETTSKGCTGAANIKTIVVDDKPPSLVITGPNEVCENQTAIPYSVPQLGPGTTYAWSVPPGASVISGQGTFSVLVNFGNTPGTIEMVPTTLTGCAGNPTDLAVTVNLTPSLDDLSNNVCSDNPSNILLSGTGAATFNITNVLVPPGLAPPFRSLASGAPSTEIQSDIFTNATGGNLTVQYTVVPVSAQNCPGTPKLVNLVVRPEPTLAPGLAQEICSTTESVSLVLSVATGSVAASSYDVVINANGLIQLAGAEAGPGPYGPSVLLGDKWQNLTTSPVDVQYTVRPISASGCVGDPPVDIFVAVNPEPVINPIIPNPDEICSGDTPTPTFSANITASFNWLPTVINGLIGGPTSGTGSTISNVLTNSGVTQGSVRYEVTPVSTKGCAGVPANVDVLVNPLPGAAQQNLVVCSDGVGGNTYATNLTSLENSINSGTVTFIWYQNAALTIPIATPGSYTVTNNVPVYVQVSDALCSNTGIVTYQVNPTPSVTASITSNYNGFQISCTGASDGQLTAVPANGTFPYQFSIDGGVTFFNTPIFNGLSEVGGPYTVTVRDVNACTNTAAPITFTNPPVISGTTDVKTPYNGQNVSCLNAADGSVEIFPIGGAGGGVQGNYSYRILELPGNTSGNITGVYTGLRAGQYTIVVTDANACQVTLPLVTLTEPSAVLATAVLTSPVSCNGQSDGVITVTGSGGTLINPNYNFTLNQPPASSNTTGVFSGLAAGSYTVTVRDDNNCAAVSGTVVVIQPAILTAFANVTSSYNGAQISCNGANDGQITGIANGGNGTFTYTLVINGVDGPSGPANVFNSLQPGNYAVRVRDAGLCEVLSTPVTINEPLPVVASGVANGAISCNGGSDGRITISGAGGTGFYTYSQLPAPPGPSNISGIFMGFADGTYDFRVTDANNCFDEVSVTIIEPTSIVPNVVVSAPYNGSQISCNGASDAIIAVSATGGNGVYRFAFVEFASNTTGQFSGVFTGVPASGGINPPSYTFTVRDGNNCQITTNPVLVIQPAAVVLNGTVLKPAAYNGEDVSCNGASDGFITLTATGGTVLTNYTYRIDQVPSNVSGISTGAFSGLGAGSYTATVRDVNGCLGTFGPIVVTQPSVVTASLTITSNYNGRNISCFGAADGIIQVIANGGVANYNYELIQTGAVINNSPSPQDFTNLLAGSYSVRVTDRNGCERLSAPITLTEPAVIQASATITSNYNGHQVSCFGSSDGAITITQTGGTPGYNYEFQGNAGSNQLSNIFTGLIANNAYTFEVKDVNNCIAVTNTLQLTEPPPLAASADVTSDYNGQDISCNEVADGIITIAYSGGTGIPVNVFDQFSISNQTGKFSGIFTSVPAGNGYTFTVSDVNGCAVVTAPVNVIQPDAISGTGSVTSNFNGFDISCFNATDGAISISAAGGTAPLAYLLLENPGNITGAVNGVFQNLRAGSYRVRIADLNGCLFTTQPTIVNQPSDLTVTIAKTSNHNGFDLSCNGASDGEVSVVIASGGAGGYSYELFKDGLTTGNASGQLNGLFTGLFSGLYDVSMKDVNNCVKKSLPVVLVDPLPLFEGILGFDQAICFNQDNPNPIADIAPAFGSIGNYLYQWQSSADGVNFTDVAGASNASFTPPSNLGSNTFFRRNIISGCANGVSNTVKVTINSIPVATLTPSKSPVCEGEFFVLNFDFQNGQAPYYFDYNDGSVFVIDRIGADATPVPVLNYTDTKTFTLTRLRDFNGCVATVLPAPVTVPVSKINPNFSITSPPAQCSGGTFNFQWTVNPNIQYTWTWSDGQTEVIAPNSRPNGTNSISHDFVSLNTSGNTNFPVILSAVNTVDGCGPKQANQTVTIYPNILINVFPDKTEICSGEQVTIVNPTQGGVSHQWELVRQSDGQVLDTRNFNAATNQSFTINNNLPTALNPDIYNIIYSVSNANCSDQKIVPVTVYENIVAGFTVGSVPQYTGTPVTVSITNTSVPIDLSNFSYSWEFGTASAPGTSNGEGPFDIVYSSPGFKDIKLSVVNTVAQARGLSCQSVAQQTINILVPPFEARFEYVPVVACFPTQISITENYAVAGTNPFWQLIDQNGRVVGTSNVDNPVFDIINPGTYTIYLQVTNPLTGQMAFADNSGAGPNALPNKEPIPVYPKPQAVFQARPLTLFIPDTELITLNGSIPTNEPSDEVAFLWNFGENDAVIKTLYQQPSPTYLYSTVGEFTISMIMTETRGTITCSDTAYAEVKTLQGGQIRIPNAFTPDLSGPNGGIPREGTYNDVFLPLFKGIDLSEPGSFKMQIYDRWGNLLFEFINAGGTEPVRGWDGYDKNGVLFPPGVYVYKLDLKFSDGQRSTKIGDVTLLR